MRTFVALLTLVWLLSAGEASHFHGGTISWSPLWGNKVRFKYQVGWPQDSKEGGGCTDGDVDLKTILMSSYEWKCTESCSDNVSLTYRCVDHNDRYNWMVGVGSFNLTLPSNQTSKLTFANCCWSATMGQTDGVSTTRSNATDWSLSATITVQPRKDTGRINNSPVTALKAYNRLKAGCQSNISLPFYDHDGDKVRCRLAKGINECGGACAEIPFGKLIEENCTLFFNPTASATGSWVVTLMVEDYPGANITVEPYSSVPLQMLLEFVPTKSCCQLSFVRTTPGRNKVFQIPAGSTFNTKIEIEVDIVGVHVERLGIITDKDVQTDRIQADETVQGLFYTYLTWQSEPDRLGFAQICFYAISTDGDETELRCIFVVPKCTEGSNYTTCVPRNRSTCWSIDATPMVTPDCDEGCVCNGNLLWDGDKCVVPNDCGCIKQQQYFKVGFHVDLSTLQVMGVVTVWSLLVFL
uniref:uncharacterized protein n=1 Tax=Myxine glutinosa TaxID=7769 RepID=UPI00358E4D9D